MSLKPIVILNQKYNVYNNTLCQEAMNTDFFDLICDKLEESATLSNADKMWLIFQNNIHCFDNDKKFDITIRYIKFLTNIQNLRYNQFYQIIMNIDYHMNSDKEEWKTFMVKFI